MLQDEDKLGSQKIVLCNTFIETEIIHFKRKLFKVFNTTLKIGNKTGSILYIYFKWTNSAKNILKRVSGKLSHPDSIFFIL